MKTMESAGSPWVKTTSPLRYMELVTPRSALARNALASNVAFAFLATTDFPFGLAPTLSRHRRVSATILVRGRITGRPGAVGADRGSRPTLTPSIPLQVFE